MLAQWREARGDDAMGLWVWWVGYPDDDCYSEDAKTREEAIEIGQARYVQDGAFEIIEARMWNDLAKDGDEVCSFAESRNREKIAVEEGGANG